MTVQATRGFAGRVARLALGLLLLTSLLPASGAARVFLTVDEALELAFPGCEIERRTVFLTQEQRRRAQELAGLEVDSRLVHPYVATCRGEVAGVAYFDSHPVRTLPETVMVVVSAQGAVERVEVLSFLEPEEYLPRRTWYRQFLAQPLSDELELDRSIRPVTGATLTARATADAVRRILAVHEVVSEEGP